MKLNITYGIMLIIVFLIAVAGIYYVTEPAPSPQQTVANQLQQIENPNQINGLEAELSQYQVVIKYTPEPGAKVLRVEYIRKMGYHGEGATEAFDFPLNGTPLTTTFQRDASGSPNSGMRVTIIYDNNVIKFVEFKT